MIIDTHCHTSQVWYEPIEVLLHQMDSNGIDVAILIQMASETDNSYQTSCVSQYPDRLVSVVAVDNKNSKAPEHLEKLVEHGAKGIRLSPDTRSCSHDPIEIWRKADELGIPVSLKGNSELFQSKYFLSLLLELPNLQIVVEHLGGLNHPVSIDIQRKAILSLSRFPNVHMKFHGLGELSNRIIPVSAENIFAVEGIGVLKDAIKAFSPFRMMWGSDFPPVSNREGYSNALNLPKKYLAYLSQKEINQLFSLTARKVFNLQ